MQRRYKFFNEQNELITMGTLFDAGLGQTEIGRELNGQIVVSVEVDDEFLDSDGNLIVNLTETEQMKKDIVALLSRVAMLEQEIPE